MKLKQLGKIVVVRLQKYLAMAGVASRRRAERLIQAGQVAVNGQIIQQMGQQVAMTDQVTVNGRLVKPVTQLLYYALHKPKGVITTSQDESKRKTVLDLVPKTPVVVACGRLDADTRGLVILTNDGQLCQELTHPRYQHEKEYQVEATINHGPALSERFKRLEQGITLEDGLTSPAVVSQIKRTGMKVHFHLTITEGRNRQVRRMCSAVGFDVLDLLRVRVGSVVLGDLAPGQWRIVQKADF